MNRLNSESAPFRHREILLTTCLVACAAIVGLVAAEPLVQGVEFVFDGMMERGRQVLDAHHAFGRG